MGDPYGIPLTHGFRVAHTGQLGCSADYAKTTEQMLPGFVGIRGLDLR